MVVLSVGDSSEIGDLHGKVLGRSNVPGAHDSELIAGETAAEVAVLHDIHRGSPGFLASEGHDLLAESQGKPTDRSPGHVGVVYGFQQVVKCVGTEVGVEALAELVVDLPVLADSALDVPAEVVHAEMDGGIFAPGHIGPERAAHLKGHVVVVQESLGDLAVQKGVCNRPCPGRVC